MVVVHGIIVRRGSVIFCKEGGESARQRVSEASGRSSRMGFVVSHSDPIERKVRAPGSVISLRG
jgi:hypothetical protein